MPRVFQDNPNDRYIFEEEGDVTEITFIMKGDWCVGFNSHTKDDLSELGAEAT